MSTQLVAPEVHVSTPVFTERDFKTLAGSFLTGVAIVLVESDGVVEGCTISSLTSVSLEPPLMLFCIARDSRTLDAMRESGRMGLSILAAEHRSRELAGQFARPGPKYVDQADLDRTPSGQPVISRGLATAELTIQREYPAGDHVIVLAAPTWTSARAGSPLAYWRSQLFDPQHPRDL